MSNKRLKFLNDVLFFFYGLFIFGSTFSIALAQLSLGFALVLFIIIAITVQHNPFVSIKQFYKGINTCEHASLKKISRWGEYGV